MSGVVNIVPGGEVRVFDTGATRDTDEGKLDYEGFIDPSVLKRYAEYMHVHRVQSDGTLRDSDNWQRGIPKSAYMKSMFRHFMDAWLFHRGRYVQADFEDVLCAIIFNAMGYLSVILKEQREGIRDEF